ncbi:hypothetical protein TUMEXPCC7403_12515 [Tumidithrix helvetica PCC 7403]|uniref:hypothetical protein n=1 Tax=Tumidithrix helvetica TaxID=3457545 RepID=UPI003CBBD3F4
MSMSGIQIYVKTSALGGDGIHWRNASKPDQPREIPPIINPDVKESCIVPNPRNPTGYTTVEFFVSTEQKPSILLVSHAGKLFLEVTGIEATQERSNKLGREIFDVIAWLADDNEENDQVFRNITAKALLGFWSDDKKFFDAIRNSVKFQGKDAFVTDISFFANLAIMEPLPNGNLSEVQTLDNLWIQSFKINSEQEVLTLVNQISLKPLPKDVSPFVFVIKQEKECIQFSRVNLSKKADLQDTNQPKIVEPLITGLTEVKTDDSNKIEAPAKKKPQQISKLAIFLIVILVVLIFGLAVAVILWFM